MSTQLGQNDVTKPRLCLLTETFHPEVGGGETQAKSLAEGLIGAGYKVFAVTRRSASTLARFENVGLVPVYRVSPSGTAHWKKWGLLFTIGPTLIRLRREYDVILVSGFRLLGVSAVLVSKLIGKRCILKADSLGEMSGEFFGPGLARFRLTVSSLPFRLFLRVRNSVVCRADVYVAISRAVSQELIAQGIPEERIRGIPNSVDVDLFCPVNVQRKCELRRKLALPVTARVVIFTGRLVSYKGLPLLLHVWREIQDKYRDVRLLLVGSGGLDMHNCEQELRAYVDVHQLHDSVWFTGNVTNVYEYLQAADIFAFPSENEAFGVSLIEAMACGLAVISTPVGGLKDIVQNDLNGLVVPPGDFPQLLASLDRLLGNAAICERLGRVAQETVRERYAASTVLRQYVELLATERNKCPGHDESCSGSSHVP